MTPKDKFIAVVVEYAPWIMLASILLVMIIGMGAGRLHLESGIKVFFDESDPNLLAQEEIERTYGKEDNILLVIEAVNGDTFTPQNLASIGAITEQSWHIPNSKRVDSVTNYLYPVVDGDDSTKIINGTIHAPALPCETAVYFDGTKIQIDMLNPVAIFTLFFTDVLFGDQMKDPEFAQAIQELPVKVNDEIVSIIYAALNGEGIAFDGIKFTEKQKPLGPKYQWLDEVVEEVANTPSQSPFVHFSYTKLDGSLVDGAYVKHVADTIVAAASTNGIHDPALDNDLNETDWRSARPGPLPIPGNQVIEMCSPTNAIKAMSTGMHHATALPCEVAVTAIEGGSKLLISYLDPHFMFNALFKDAFNQMSEEDLAEFAALPPLVLADLQTIVGYALTNLGELSDPEDPEQVFYNMLPTTD